MSRRRLWWVPLLLLAAPLFHRAPLPRDMEDFFLPMRQMTAARVAEASPPWLNQANGCGEPWFANPETGVLYPPHLAYVLFPTRWAVSFEAGLHLALLALGVGVLARRLGADGPGVAVAEAAAWSSGAVLSTVGVINNLDTLAWLPWLIVAARRRDRWTVPAVAAAGALAWLGGEPQLWALGVGLAILFAADLRRTALGCGLAAGLVAVQLAPFLAWVTGGSRGGGEAATYLAGAVSPAGWLRTLAPGIPAPGSGHPYVESLFLGAPLLVCLLLGVRERWPVALPAVPLAVMATLPALGLGPVYLLITRSMVRYPSRFAVAAVVFLLPFIGPGVERWLAGRGRAPGVVVGLAALLLAGSSPSPWLAAVTVAGGAATLLAAALPGIRGLRGTAVAVGVAVCVAAGWPLLGLRAPDATPSPWPELAGGERLYTPPPPTVPGVWTSASIEDRLMWPMGYLNLRDGASLARTYAPVTNRRLAEHLRLADAGPAGRGWLNALSAPWVVLARPVNAPLLAARRRVRGLWLYRNRTALPLVAVAADPVQGGERWRPARAVVTFAAAQDGLRAWVLAPAPVRASIGLTPLAGWRWRLDGGPVTPRTGPGARQEIAVPAGAHLIEGAYRPPGLALGATVSAVSLVTLLGLAWSGLGRGKGLR